MVLVTDSKQVPVSRKPFQLLLTDSFDCDKSGGPTSSFYSSLQHLFLWNASDTQWRATFRCHRQDYKGCPDQHKELAKTLACCHSVQFCLHNAPVQIHVLRDIRCPMARVSVFLEQDRGEKFSPTRRSMISGSCLRNDEVIRFPGKDTSAHQGLKGTQKHQKTFPTDTPIYR